MRITKCIEEVFTGTFFAFLILNFQFGRTRLEEFSRRILSRLEKKYNPRDLKKKHVHDAEIEIK